MTKVKVSDLKCFCCKRPLFWIADVKLYTCMHEGCIYDGIGMTRGMYKRWEIRVEDIRRIIIDEELMPAVCEDSGQAEWTVEESKKLAIAIYNMKKEEGVKDKKDKRWCSKHQRVHGEKVFYWSCRFPNDKERNKKFNDWRKNPWSKD